MRALILLSLFLFAQPAFAQPEKGKAKKTMGVEGKHKRLGKELEQLERGGAQPKKLEKKPKVDGKMKSKAARVKADMKARRKVREPGAKGRGKGMRKGMRKGMGKGSMKRADRRRRRLRAQEQRRQRLSKFVKDGKLPPPLLQEVKRHARRIARIDRIEDVAAEKNDVDALARIEKLRDKERARHQKFITQFEEKGGQP